MVAAVPMVMHMPAERAMPLSMSFQSWIVIAPAWSTPRLTSCTRSLKCAWHWLRSDQVLTIATTGLPA
jgi:hypothetical protein